MTINFSLTQFGLLACLYACTQASPPSQTPSTTPNNTNQYSNYTPTNTTNTNSTSSSSSLPVIPAVTPTSAPTVPTNAINLAPTAPTAPVVNVNSSDKTGSNGSQQKNCKKDSNFTNTVQCSNMAHMGANNTGWFVSNDTCCTQSNQYIVSDSTSYPFLVYLGSKSNTPVAFLKIQDVVDYYSNSDGINAAASALIDCITNEQGGQACATRCLGTLNDCSSNLDGSAWKKITEAMKGYYYTN